MMDRDKAWELWKIFLKTLLAIIILVALIYVSKKILGDTLQDAAKLFIEKFGIIGLFIDVYLVDTLIVPLTPDIFLAILISAEGNQLPGLILICLASVLGGISGYGIGRYLGDVRLVLNMVKKYKEKGSQLFQRWGTWAVIIAAFTPLPFSTICWLAGMFKMNFRSFVFASLFRIPRMILWYGFIALGWLY
ncbi:DedA family protein [candidate division KSB1 bacterium]|nr:DedA family protein [candidate division KSB1 bacterium]